MFDTLINLFKKGVPGAAHKGATPVIFLDVYKELDFKSRIVKWNFSWRTSDHKDGGVEGPFYFKQDAVFARDRFVETFRGDRLFVYQGDN